MKINFLDETEQHLKRTYTSIDQILYVGDGHYYRITWDEFKELADFDYDNEDMNEIVRDLYIVGDGFYHRRLDGGCDGISRWEKIYVPSQIPKMSQNFKTIKCHRGKSLEKVNRIDIHTGHNGCNYYEYCKEEFCKNIPVYSKPDWVKERRL